MILKKVRLYMSRSNNIPDLNKLQIKADIVVAENALTEAKSSKPKLAKYLKGQVGYHLQQAAENSSRFKYIVQAKKSIIQDYTNTILNILSIMPIQKILI